MPAAASATLQVSLNGGGPASGGLTALNGDVVQLSAVTTVGWTQQRYEIYSFYSASEFPLPAGWTQGTSPRNYYYNASAVPPPFTLPAGPAFGKFLLRLTVNNGLNGFAQADPILIDTSSALRIVSTNGLQDLVWAEDLQFSAEHKWVEDHAANLRALDTSIGAVASPSGSVVAVTPAAGTAGAANTFSRGDHRHQVTTAVPSVTVKSDASSAAIGTATSVLRTDAQILALTAAPSTVGTANAQGSSTSLARADHVHDHGAQSTSTLHAKATASAEGFMDRADKAKLDASTAASTSSTLFFRDGSANGALNQLTANGITLGQSGLDATGYVAFVPSILAYAAAIVMDGKTGSRQDVTLTGNVTFNAPINYGVGATLEVMVQQGVGAPFTASWNAAAFVFSSGLSGTLIGVVQDDVDYFEFKRRLGYWVCVVHVKHALP